LFHRYESTRAFQRIGERTQKDYRRFLGLIVDTPLKGGGKLGDLTLTSISARAVDKVYEVLSAPARAAQSAARPRKNKTPPAPESAADQPPVRPSVAEVRAALHQAH
jgi:hypothetical protein